MATYFMFGNYSQESIKEMDVKRTEKAISVIENHGGKFTAGYALLGDPVEHSPSALQSMTRPPSQISWVAPSPMAAS